MQDTVVVTTQAQTGKLAVVNVTHNNCKFAIVKFEGKLPEMTLKSTTDNTVRSNFRLAE